MGHNITCGDVPRDQQDIERAYFWLAFTELAKAFPGGSVAGMQLQLAATRCGLGFSAFGNAETEFGDRGETFGWSQREWVVARMAARDGVR